MSVGSLITLSPELRIIHRSPFWPWPAPGAYPKYLPNGTIQMFFPHLYTRFRIGDYLRPQEIFPYFPKEPSMKTLAKNVRLTLASRKYVCDILLSMYVNTKRPAIILCESRPDTFPGEAAWAGEPVAVASTNAPPEYLQHLPLHFTAMKVWSENEGLLPQLLALRTDFDTPLFTLSDTKITLGFCTSPVIELGPLVKALHAELISTMKEPNHG